MRKFRLPTLDAILDRRERHAGTPSLVVVGLGNPGSKYANTRHNAGFWCIDRLAKEHSVTLERRNRQALIGDCGIEGQRVILAKPRTFVNLSGEAVSYLLARYKVSSQNLLVICDDIALPTGKIRLRARGSAGGHNGIKSIIEALGTQDFPRLRIGVGGTPEGGNQIEHVLGKLSPEEQKAVDDAVERAVKLVCSLLIDGIDTAMNRFN